MLKFIVCLGFSLFIGWLLSVHVASVHAVLPFEFNRGIGITWLPVAFVVCLFFSHRIVSGKH